jgi:uncharacterized membrane protein
MKKLMKKLFDRDIEFYMSMLLITGVIISGIVVFIGCIVYLYQNKYMTSNYNVFIGEPERLRNTYEIMRGALNFQGRALIQFGILLLISTPVARVLFAVLGFFMENDKLYTLISLIVLGILMVSLVGAIN